MNNTVEEVVETTYKELFVEANKRIDDLTLQNDKLGNTLKKALEMIILLDYEVCALDDRFTRKKREEWEAWLLKDE